MQTIIELPVVPGTTGQAEPTTKTAKRAAKVGKARAARVAKGLGDNIDDETLLDDVTRAARDAVNAQKSLADAVKACVQANIDRDDVIAAAIAGGFSESYARSTVSVIYGQEKGRVRKVGAGRETPAEAIRFAENILKAEANSYKRAQKIALAAYRHLKLMAGHAARAEAKSATTTAEALKAA